MSEKITSKNFRTESEIKLPVSGITVVVYSALLVGEVSQIDMKKSDMEVGVQSAVKLIKSWNFYDKETDDQPLPITIENLNRLPANDLSFLSSTVAELSTAQKKS